MAALLASEPRRSERRGTHLVRGCRFSRRSSANGRFNGVRAAVRDRARGAEILALVLQNLQRATAFFHAGYNSSPRSACIDGSKTRSARQNCSISYRTMMPPMKGLATFQRKITLQSAFDERQQSSAG